MLIRMAPLDDEEIPPPEPDQFFLKTAPFFPDREGRFTGGMYLRQHSIDNPSVVLSPDPPKYLRANVSENGLGVEFSSWAQRHAGRQWGLVLKSESAHKAGWERVEIIMEGEIDESLVFAKTTKPGPNGSNDDSGDVGMEESEEEGGKEREREEEEEEELVDGDGWKGWMACQWSLGHPQLFWITAELKGELPEFCERVRIVREFIAESNDVEADVVV
ncbi:hypothetical protein QBC46DRAFT_383868 [Diplogelasinospora grovesii]|uniref:DUF7907 domain-containing protein n=1 Tax=Diplogelasinospora grovesii TaxID=303347 RepID=A0AAN6N8B2_9PEZI|nr:hypothetical protein QBC46DRAFT_383868 [Diplogelasinospora grovesii]